MNLVSCKFSERKEGAGIRVSCPGTEGFKCIFSAGVMFKAVNDVVSDVGVGSRVFLNFELPPDKMSTLPFFKCALIL